MLDIAKILPSVTGLGSKRGITVKNTMIVNLLCCIMVALFTRNHMLKFEVNIFIKTLSLTFYNIDTHFDTSTTDSFENIVEKEEIARAISPSPTMFSTQSGNYIPICSYF